MLAAYGIAAFQRAHTSLRTRYAMSGTEKAHQPTHTLCTVRYCAGTPGLCAINSCQCSAPGDEMGAASIAYVSTGHGVGERRLVPDMA
eukprot:564304-Rhodomonas_salina.3